MIISNKKIQLRRYLREATQVCALWVEEVKLKDCNGMCGWVGCVGELSVRIPFGNMFLLWIHDERTSARLHQLWNQSIRPPEAHLQTTCDVDDDDVNDDDVDDDDVNYVDGVEDVKRW